MTRPGKATASSRARALGRESDVHGAQTVCELRPGARNDDRAGDARLLRHPGERHLAGCGPLLMRQGGDHLQHPEGGVGEVGVPSPPAPPQPAPRWRRLATPVLTAEIATGQGGPREYGEAVGLGHGDQLSLDAAVQQMIRRLLAYDAVQPEFFRHPQRFHQLPGGEGAGAEVAHLAAADEVVQGPQGLVDGDGRQGALELVEIDVIGLQPPERGLALLQDVTPAVAPGVRDRASSMCPWTFVASTTRACCRSRRSARPMISSLRPRL